MKKSIFKKIGGLFLGLDMGLGVAVGVTAGNKASETRAASVNDKFVLLTDASDLSAGDEIIFVNSAKTYAGGTTQNSNNRSISKITFAADGSWSYSSTAGIQTMILGGDNKGWTFNIGSSSNPSYLYSPSASNYLRNKTDLDNTCEFTIVASTKTTGAFTINCVGRTAYYIQFNGTTCLSCYKNTQPDPLIYVKESGSAKTVTGLSISGDMTKKTYSTSDEYDPSGLTVTATYDNNPSDTENVTSKATFTYDPQSLTAGMTSVSVTATYGGKTSEAKNITGLTVTAPSFTNSTNLAEGKYFISIKDGSTTKYLKSVASGKGALSDNVTDALEFTFKLVGNDLWTIKNGDNYLGIGNSSTSLSLDTTKYELAIAWDNQDSGTRKIGGNLTGSRYIAYYSSGPDLRTYTSGTLGLLLVPAVIHTPITDIALSGTGVSNNALAIASSDTTAHTITVTLDPTNPTDNIVNIAYSEGTNGLFTLSSPQITCTNGVGTFTLTGTGATSGTEKFTISGNTETTVSKVLTVNAFDDTVTNYTVSFNSMGGSESPANKTVEENTTFTFPSPGTKEHYTFDGWSSDGGTTKYKSGISPAVTANTTYTAYWVEDAKYIITYSAGENGTGISQTAPQYKGSYMLPAFTDLTEISANAGYKFSHYSVGGVSKNPGETIDLTAATTIDVIFMEIPLECTYDMTKISDFSSWSTGYNTHSGITFTPDPEYSATIDLFGASKQSSGVGSTYPCLAFKSVTEVELIDFSLTQEGYKIETVEIVFVQRGTNKPTLSLHKGSGIDSDAVATLAIDGEASSEQTLSFNNLNDTVFTVGYSNGNTGSNISVGLKSIIVGLSVQGSFGDLDHISISKNPKNIYTLGDLNDVTGINITAYDAADESTANIMSLGYDSEGVSFSIMNNSTLTNLGSNTNTVSYTNGSITKTTSYEIVVYDLASFNKISKEQTDWSGVYLIYSENYIFDSSLNNSDQDNNVVSVNIEDDAITCGQQFAVTIEKYSDGYSIKLLNGKYIGNSLSDNGLTVSDTALVNKISYNTTNNNVVITNAAGNTTFRLYSTTSTDRFRYYKNSSTGSEIQLFKLATSSALEEAENWARDNFIIECDATGETAPDVEMWGLIAESFDADLGDNAKIIFKEAIGNSSSEASIVEQTVAKYDYIVGKYGSATYVDFMSRSPSNGARVNPIANLSNVDNSVWVISAVAVAGLTAIGGYFFYRKRKEI